MDEPPTPDQTGIAPPRDNRLWLLFLLIGAAIGISVGMMFFEDQSERGRVHLEVGGTAMTLGAFVGWFIGIPVELLSRWSFRFASIARVIAVALLLGSISAPIGRLYVNLTAPNIDEYQRFAPLGMASGAIFGTVVGLVIGLVAERRRTAR